MIDREKSLIVGENLINQLDVVESGMTIRDCQLSHSKGMTKIFVGIKGLNFESGNNLRGCIVPDDAIVGKDNLYDPNPDSPLQKDIVEQTEDEITLEQKKMEIEQQAVDDYRIEVRAQLAEVASVDEIPVKEDLQIAIAQKAVDMKPVPIQPIGKVE